MTIFFFFQAEDGIRDKLVTGVQTCALPISHGATQLRRPGGGRKVSGAMSESQGAHGAPATLRQAQGRPEQRRGARSGAGQGARSEERRVGKECRARWAPDD